MNKQLQLHCFGKFIFAQRPSQPLFFSISMILICFSKPKEKWGKISLDSF